MEYFAQKEEDLFKSLDSSKTGLTSDGASKKLAQFGYNEIKQKKKISPLAIFLEQFNNFLVYILIGATIVSFFLKEYSDAIVILLIVVLNAVLGFVQEFRAESSIEALKSLMKQKSRVLRDSRIINIEA